MQRARLTIANELIDNIFLKVGKAHHYLDANTFEFRMFQREAEKLRSADAYMGSIAEAWIHHWAGDIEQARYWLRNAVKNHGLPHRCDLSEAIFLSNLGYFSRAREILLRDELQDWIRSLSSLHVLSICFGALIAHPSEWQSAADDEWMADARNAKDYTATMRELNITEAQAAAVMDAAGEVLREHRMFFAGTHPVIHAADGGMLLQLAVQASIEEISSMTEEVIDKLIDRELIVPGLSFSFIPDHATDHA